MFSLVPFAAATAANKTLPADNTAWFWSSNQQFTVIGNDPQLGAAPTASIGDGAHGGTPSGVGEPISEGHLGVSMKDGDSDMRSYIKFDHKDIPLGSTITSYIVTLTVSSAAGGHGDEHSKRAIKVPATVNQDHAFIQACAITSPFSSNATGDPPYNTTVERREDNTTNVTTEKTEPEADCSLSVEGKKASDGTTWTFDITEIAKKWASGQLSHEGIAILPEPRGVKPTWTIEFHGAFTSVRNAQDDDVILVTQKEMAKVAIEYEPASVIPPPPPTFPPSTTTGGFPSFGNDGVVTPPTEGPPLPPPSTGGSTGGGTTGGAVGGGVPAGGKAQTPGWLYGLIPLGLVGLGLVSSAVAADAPTGATATNRVASVLRRRRLDGGEGLGEAEAIEGEELQSPQ